LLRLGLSYLGVIEEYRTDEQGISNVEVRRKITIVS
jgi:hypothetical protein